MSYNIDNIFRKIIDNGDNFIYEDENTIVIQDKFPKKKIHLLIIPKENITNLYHLMNDSKHKHLITSLFNTVHIMVERYEIKNNFKIEINNGEKSGQEIQHLHLHILSDGNI